MARDAIPLYISDLSGFAKTLRAELASAQTPPGHAAFLAMIARAAGQHNFQTVKAGAEKPLPDADKRALRVFNAQGRMTRWPKQTKIQGLCLWPAWRALPARRDLTETEVNDILRRFNTFDDHVLLRRSLIDHGLVTRTVDGRVYRRIEQAPPEEARALFRALDRR